MDTQKRITGMLVFILFFIVLYIVSTLTIIPLTLRYAFSTLLWFILAVLPIAFVSFYAMQAWKTRKPEALVLLIVWALITIFAVPNYAAKTYFFARATYQAFMNGKL